MSEWLKPIATALVTAALTYFGIAAPKMGNQQQACDAAILFLIDEAREK